MSFLDNDLLLYLLILLIFLGFFYWNRRQAKKYREGHRSKNFRNRYLEKKKRRYGR